jgi:hypothetical protein
MAIVRLAKLEDLDNLAALAHGIVSAPSVPAPAPSRVEAAPREKKTTDMTPPAAAPVADAAVENAAPPGVAPAGASCVAAPEQPNPPPALPADPRAAWLQACETVGGLAADFAAAATEVRWNDGVLEVVIPAAATTAATFLRRPEAAAGIARALSDVAGQPLRHTIVVSQAAPAEGLPGPAVERPRPVPSQAALLRDVMDHPLVTQARTLFDAAVRKVEPARPADPVPTGAAATAASPAAATAVAEEESDG